MDSAGQKFTRALPVAMGKVQAMWFGVEVPEAAAPGTYSGTLTIVGAVSITATGKNITLDDGTTTTTAALEVESGVVTESAMDYAAERGIEIEISRSRNS